MSSPPVRILHVDDEPDFADMAATFLERQEDAFSVDTVTSVSEARERLTATAYDCIVSDYDMPGEDGIEFLEAVREDHPDLPFVLYTGKGSEEVASDAISAGVTDYLQKETGSSQYEVLANRIANAVEQYRSKRGLEASQQRLSLFIDQSALGVIEWDEDFDVARMNEAAEAILGYDEDELVGESWETIVPESDREPVDEVVTRLLENEGGYHSINENVRRDGEVIVCEWHNRVVTDDVGDVVAIFSQFQDVTERQEREWAVEALHDTTRELMKAGEAKAVAEIVVEAVRDILDLPANGVHLYDPDAHELRPVAWTDYGTELVGEVPNFAPGGSLAWEVFETGEPRQYDDVSSAPGRHNPDTLIRSEIILPLDDHGVCVIGSAEAGAFDEMDVSLAKTLTAHATTALDRIDRDRRLARQRSLLEAQQEAVLDGILVVDEDRQVVSYNQRFVELWGLPTYLVERGDDEAILEAVTDQLAEPEAFSEQLEHLYEHPRETAREEIELADGRVFDRYTTPLTGGEDTYYGRLWTFRDVTDRERRERTLAELVDRIQSLIGSSTREDASEVAVEIARTVLDAPLAGVHLLSADGERLEAVALLDDVREELGVTPVYHRDGENEKSRIVWETFEGGEPRYFPDIAERSSLAEETPASAAFVYPLGDHGVLIVSTTEPEGFEQTVRMYAELLGQSVTAALDRVEREVDLRGQKSRLEALHEATGDLLAAESPAAVAERVVQAAHEILGFPITLVRFYDEAAGGLVPVAETEISREVFDPQDVFEAGSESLNWAAYESGSTAVYEDISEIDRARDSEGPIDSLMLFPMGEHGTMSVADTVPRSFDESDRFHGELLAQTATLALSQLDRERELTEQRDALDRQNARLEQFAGVVSHDLRNPLNVAQGRLDLLAEDVESEDLVRAKRALDRMEGLLDDLLTLARVGEDLGETEPVELAAVAEACSRNVELGSATLRIETSQVIRADRSRLQQLLENLFRNAVEHAGDAPTVTVGDLEDGFYVEDDGPGIAADERGQVIEAGYTSAEEGTGFGLSIVREIAGAHGWSTSLEEGSEGGLRVAFTGVASAG